MRMPVFSDAVPAQAASASCIDISALKGRESISGGFTPLLCAQGGLVSSSLLDKRQNSQGASSAPLFGDEACDDFGEHLRNAGCGCRAGRASLTLPVALARAASPCR